MSRNISPKSEGFNFGSSRRASYDVLGLMSGTSLDGLDILHVRFSSPSGNGKFACTLLPKSSKVGVEEPLRWNFELLEAGTFPYPEHLRCRLADAMQMSGLDLNLLSVDLGRFIGKKIRDFVEVNSINPDFAAVHGHTVFHRPELGLSCQIGNGAAIAVESGLVIVNDFRSTDVALGGQGAPLVPIGDQLLFSDYEFCLNLGGISNISYQEDSGKRIAFDISLCNIALNYFSSMLGMPYDRDGNWAREGDLNVALLDDLNALDYYSRSFPKSLGYEFFQDVFLPLVIRHYPALSGGLGENRFSDEISVSCLHRDVCDVLHTVCEHIAYQVGRILQSAHLENRQSKNGMGYGEDARLLLTGGGALNLYLKERITDYAHGNGRLSVSCVASGQLERIVDIVDVDRKLIDYKEALIFALLGVLRMENENNALASVTGARCDSIGGAVYLPPYRY